MHIKDKYSIFYVLVSIGILVTFIFNVIDCLYYPKSRGDESFYIKEVRRLTETGLWNTFSSGTSHLYVVLGFIFTKLSGSDLVGLRLLSISLSFILMYLFYKISLLELSNIYLRTLFMLTVSYVIYCSQAGKCFFMGISDPLMITIALATIMFIMLYVNLGKTKYIILSAIFSGMLFWVRTFSLLIYVGILCWIVLSPFILRNYLSFKRYIRNICLFLAINVITISLVQIPSLLTNSTFTFENKSKIMGLDWEANNWLTGLQRRPTNSIFCYSKLPWDEVEDYITKFGYSSIPRNYVERFKRNPKMIVEAFSANLLFRVPFVLFVNIGFLIIPLIYILKMPEKWFSIISSKDWLILLVFIIMPISLSLVTIDYIEQRWLLFPIFMGALLGVRMMLLVNNIKFKKAIYNLQLIFLLIVIYYRLLKYFVCHII